MPRKKKKIIKDNSPSISSLLARLLSELLRDMSFLTPLPPGTTDAVVASSVDWSFACSWTPLGTTDDVVAASASFYKLYTGDPLGQVSVECAVAIKFIIIILFNVVVCCCLSFPRCLRSSMRDTQYSHSQTKTWIRTCYGLSCTSWSRWTILGGKM